MKKKPKSKYFKPNEKQLKILKEGWAKFELISDKFHKDLWDIEKWMIKETGIEGLEFLHDTMCMGWLGIGTFPPDMELQHADDLRGNDGDTENLE